MSIKYSTEKSLPVRFTHDRDNKEVYILFGRPKVWEANLEVIENDVIVIPTTANGCMYIVAQSGKTGTVEPTWKTNSNDIITDNTCKFKTIPYNLCLRTGDSITSFEFLPITGLIIDNTSLVAGSIIKFRVTAVPSTVSEVEIVCRLSITRASGDLVQYDIPIILDII